MENLVDTQQGIPFLLTGIVILLAMNLLVVIGRFLFELFRKKTEHGDSQIVEIKATLVTTTGIVNQLKGQIDGLESDLKEIRKYRIDMQKLFYAIKTMAGKRWPEVRKAMEDDVFPNKG